MDLPVRLEQRREFFECHLSQLLDQPDRMVGWHSLLGVHQGQHRALWPIAALGRISLNGTGPSPFEPGPSSQGVAKLLLDLRLPRPCHRPIAFTETLAASAIPPLDETRSQVIAPAVAANQLV